jgi:hypothetical protein
LSILNAASPDAPPQSAEAPDVAQLAPHPLLPPMPAADDSLPPLPDADDSLRTRNSKRQKRATVLVSRRNQGQAPAAVRPVRPDFTSNHMDTILRTGNVVVECGAQGDCFFHCVLWLAQNFLPRFNLPQTVHGLRTALTNFVQASWSDIKFIPEVGIITLLLERTSNKDRPEQAIVDGFCKIWGRPGTCKFAFVSNVCLTLLCRC